METQIETVSTKEFTLFDIKVKTNIKTSKYYIYSDNKLILTSEKENSIEAIIEFADKLKIGEIELT